MEFLRLNGWERKSRQIVPCFSSRSKRNILLISQRKQRDACLKLDESRSRSGIPVKHFFHGSRMTWRFECKITVLQKLVCENYFNCKEISRFSLTFRCSSCVLQFFTSSLPSIRQQWYKRFLWLDITWRNMYVLHKSWIIHWILYIKIII